MSHIVKGRVSIAYTQEKLLVKALTGLGKIEENARLYRVGVGYTSEKYPIVLVSNCNNKYRLGYAFNSTLKCWEQYQENWGECGFWTKQVSSQVQDRYLALHYQQQLEEEGFTVKLQEHHDGTLELTAMEEVY